MAYLHWNGRRTHGYRGLWFLRLGGSWFRWWCSGRGHGHWCFRLRWIFHTAHSPIIRLLLGQFVEVESRLISHAVLESNALHYHATGTREMRLDTPASPQIAHCHKVGCFVPIGHAHIIERQNESAYQRIGTL